MGADIYLKIWAPMSPQEASGESDQAIAYLGSKGFHSAFESQKLTQ